MLLAEGLFDSLRHSFGGCLTGGAWRCGSWVGRAYKKNHIFSVDPKHLLILGSPLLGAYTQPLVHTALTRLDHVSTHCCRRFWFWDHLSDDILPRQEEFWKIQGFSLVSSSERSPVSYHMGFFLVDKASTPERSLWTWFLEQHHAVLKFFYQGIQDMESLSLHHG